MFIYKQLSVWQVGIELGDIGFSICNIRGAAQVIRVIEEDVLGVGSIRRDIAISRLGIVRTLRFTPLDRRTRNITFTIELRMLYPAFRNAVVTPVCNDAVVTNTCIVWICSCTLHRRHSRRCAELLVILLTLLFYLHHAGGIVFLTCRDVIAANAIDIAEPACTNLGGNTLAANEVVLGEAVLRDCDDRSGINGVILRLMEGNSLRSTIDIYTLQITVALDDSLACGIVALLSVTL